jgi:hypothetical protein
MNFQLVIVDNTNKFFSGVKANSPKLFNALKKKCDDLKEVFQEEFKVKRVIPTKFGYKFV